MSSPDSASEFVESPFRGIIDKKKIEQARINVEPTEVFEIPEDKCGLVIGKRGSKIQEIRSKAGVDVNLGDRNSAVDGMMKVYLWGDKEGCEDAKKIIMDIISEPTEVLEIPEDMSGVVIGKGGSKVKEIKSETGVTVSVGSRDSAVDSMIKVTLMGNKEGCDEAKKIIMDIISEVIEVFEIPEYMSGVVIGSRGSKAKEIKSETGVDVSVGSSDSEVVGGMIKVTLKGDKEGCDGAKKIIMDLISEPTDTVLELPVDMIVVVFGQRGSKIKEFQFVTGVKVNFGFLDSTVDGMIKITLKGDKEGCGKAKKMIMDLISEPTEVFEIPEDMIGVVIGKGGSKIKEIKSKTGARVSVGSRDSTVDGMIKVYLWGNNLECTVAERFITELISDRYRYQLDRLEYDEENDQYAMNGHDIDTYGHGGYCYEEF